MRNIGGWFAPLAVSGSLLALGVWAVNHRYIPTEYVALLVFVWLMLSAFLAGYRLQSPTMAAIGGGALALFLCELSFLAYFASPWRQATLYTYQDSQKYQGPDPTFKYILHPNTRSISKKFFRDGDLVFENVLYEIDAKSRRSCGPQGVRPDQAEGHALFFGGSFTFGMGVSCEQTLPHRFQSVSEGRFASFNYGAGGYGPGQMLTQLGRSELFEDITPPQGIAVYSFIQQHLSRSAPYRLDELLKYRGINLYYELQDDGALAGPFDYDAPDHPRSGLLNWFKWTTGISAIWRFFHNRIHLPLISERRALETVASICDRARRLYRERFDGEFVVLIWPRQELGADNREHFITLLRSSGIRVVEVPDMPDSTAAQIHPRDLHPSAAEYRWVAEHLWMAVRSEFPSKADARTE